MNEINKRAPSTNLLIIQRSTENRERNRKKAPRKQINGYHVLKIGAARRVDMNLLLIPEIPSSCLIVLGVISTSSAGDFCLIMASVTLKIWPRIRDICFLNCPSLKSGSKRAMPLSSCVKRSHQSGSSNFGRNLAFVSSEKGTYSQ